jgi:hypothetical protein
MGPAQNGVAARGRTVVVGVPRETETRHSAPLMFSWFRETRGKLRGGLVVMLAGLITTMMHPLGRRTDDLPPAKTPPAGAIRGPATGPRGAG